MFLANLMVFTFHVMRLYWAFLVVSQYIPA